MILTAAYILMIGFDLLVIGWVLIDIAGSGHE